MKYFLLIIVCSFLLTANIANAQLKTGAERMDIYLGLLKGKRVGVLANHTSYIGKIHLVDTLLSLNIKVVKVYSPEHGFEGNFADGATIKDGSYKQIPLVSLYGKNKKPGPDDMKDVDVVVFDIQDVGVRFYTYISTMTYMMEACAENHVDMLVLDRPNPNAYFIDGPVLEPEFRSFVGLHPVPVVYGMTIGEYALMVNGEGWLKNGVKCNLKVIQMSQYHRSVIYDLPIHPSPNLRTKESIILYPSLCFFEGTDVSVGRGTLEPFEFVGRPDFKDGTDVFTPQSIPGISDNPKYKGQKCKGFHLKEYAKTDLAVSKGLSLKWLLLFYQTSQNKEHFFSSYFDLLAGTDKLRKQIIEGYTEEQIKASWAEDILKFRSVREKYLIYPDA